MSVLSDKWIKKMVKSHKIITPFIPKQTRKGKISYGLSSYGYDARVSDDFKIFTNVKSTIVDPKNLIRMDLFSKNQKFV
jgi:Deoxycytidine deaminase